MVTSGIGFRFGDDFGVGFGDEGDGIDTAFIGGVNFNYGGNSSVLACWVVSMLVAVHLCYVVELCCWW